jgi:hypothetical protein
MLSISIPKKTVRATSPHDGSAPTVVLSAEPLRWALLRLRAPLHPASFPLRVQLLALATDPSNRTSPASATVAPSPYPKASACLQRRRGHHRPLTSSRATPPPPPTSPTPMDRRSRCRGRHYRLTPMDAARGLARRRTPPLDFFLRDAAPVQMVSTSTSTFLPLYLASS